MKLINDIIKYIRRKEEINYYYYYALKEGICNDETYSWRERLDYWKRCVSFDPSDYQE